MKGRFATSGKQDDAANISQASKSRQARSIDHIDQLITLKR
jgi:hypothetical protein